MSTQFFSTFISTFDNQVYHNTSRSNQGNPLVLQINPNHFNLFTEIIMTGWNRSVTLLKEDAAKGKEHIERVYKHFDTPGVMRDRLADCVAHVLTPVKEHEDLFKLARRGVLENAGAIKLIYQKVILNWDEYTQDPQLFVERNLFSVIVAHCVVPALPLYKGVSILDREVLQPQDIAYLKLSREEVSKERDSSFDCGSWALLSLRVEAYAAEIKARYLDKKKFLAFLYAPLSHMKARGLHPVNDPRPGDLVMYRKGVVPMLDAMPQEVKEYNKQFDPDEPTHFGILAPDGYIHSKLTAESGVKIFRHKIWQVYENYGREVIFLRYIPNHSIDDAKV